MLELNKLYNTDCLEAMKHIPDKYFELAIVDPPYGINVNMNMGLRKGQKKKREQKDWDSEIPTAEYFNELFRVSQNQIIWGGNYFPLKPTRCFIVWDKGETMYGRSFAECEMAWTSFDQSARIYKRSPIDINRFHPTQKPTALYKWLLHKYATKGDKILDTHVGSASSIIACLDMGFEYMGFEYMGFEIDEEYYNSASKRIEDALNQVSFFNLGII
jgi:site-specific DNA-methyltransferase (adenine-specific)